MENQDKTCIFSLILIFFYHFPFTFFSQNISMHNTVGGAMAGPGSHQLTNTRMPNHDTSVVIQQAMPSPQSSSVITQAPSTNRQIGWVHSHFLIGPDVVLMVLKGQLHAGPDVVLVVFEVTEFALNPARMSKDPCSTCCRLGNGQVTPDIAAWFKKDRML